MRNLLESAKANRASIQEVARQIAHLFRPERVILFGSHAYGEPSEDSDVDLLVIMETHLRNVDQAVEIRRAIDLPFPADLLVRTPAEVADRLAQGDYFLRDVVTKGLSLTLYEAPD